MKAFKLKFVFPPKYCRHCGHQTRNRHLVVLAVNEEEAILMRSYILNEGLEA